MDTALGRRFCLLFFIDIPTRRVTLAGITTNPSGPWTTQAARNLFLTGGEAFKGCKMLVRDRAGQFTASFDEIFHTEAIKVVKTPVRTPVAKCYIEGWIEACAASCVTGPSSGTSHSSEGLSRTTSSTTTSTAHTARSANNRRRRRRARRSSRATQSQR